MNLQPLVYLYFCWRHDGEVLALLGAVDQVAVQPNLYSGVYDIYQPLRNIAQMHEVKRFSTVPELI